MNRLESLISFLAINPNVQADPTNWECRFCGNNATYPHHPVCLYEQAIADLRAVWKIDKEEGDAAPEASNHASKSIEYLDLSTRTWNCLEAEQIKTVSQLMRYSRSDLFSLKNFGATSYKEIARKMGELGLALRKESSE